MYQVKALNRTSIQEMKTAHLLLLDVALHYLEINILSWNIFITLDFFPKASSLVRSLIYLPENGSMQRHRHLSGMFR